MAEKGRPSYYYEEEERPRRRRGRGGWGFVMGLLLGLGGGFWAGRGIGPELASPGLVWGLAGVIFLAILIAMMGRFRDQPARQPLSREQTRGFVMVLVGLLLAVGLALMLLFARGM